MFKIRPSGTSVIWDFSHLGQHHVYLEGQLGDQGVPVRKLDAVASESKTRVINGMPKTSWPVICGGNYCMTRVKPSWSYTRYIIKKSYSKDLTGKKSS